MYKKKFEIKEHNGAVYSLINDENYIYSASADKFITRWNPINGQQDSFSVKCESAIYKINHLVNKSVLIIGTSLGDLHIINTKLKTELKFIKHHNAAIFDIQFDEVNNRMYIGDAHGNLSIWDTNDWSLLLTIPFECGKIRSILILNELNKVIFAAQDGKVRVLDSKFYNTIFEFFAHENGCFTLVYSELKRNILFTAGKDGFIKSWRMDDFSEILEIPAHNESIYKLKVYGSNLFSISRDKTCKIWDINSLNFVYKIEPKLGGHTHSINDFLFYESCLFTAGDDKRIICWETNFLIDV